MCGIAGIFDPAGVKVDLLARMTDLLAHRGPDDFGHVLIETNQRRSYRFQEDLPTVTGFNLGLGHRRLSIIDLSTEASQPMSVEDDRYWIVYNGEVYNYIELRDELMAQGCRFRTASDTEVILWAYIKWGENCVKRFNGMFSLVIWDGYNRRLFGARDRFGKKPFYYFWDNERFIFASEIKAILLSSDVVRTPDDASIYDFLSLGLHDHTERTFFKGIQQLPPGHFFVLNSDLTLKISHYWKLEESDFQVGDFIADFRSRFKRAIKIRLRSDVTVGSCLSGGLDSSAIVCMMDKLKRENTSESLGNIIETFSSCSDNPHYDERQYIEVVTAGTHAEKNYVFPQAEDFWNELPALINQHDEPFASASIYAQWCIMRRAHEKGIKVLLDGQGGDEILAGYRKFFFFYLISAIKKGDIHVLLRELAGILFHGDTGLFNIKEANRYLPSFMKRVVPNITGSLAPEFKAQFEGTSADIGSAATLARRQIADLNMFSVPALVRYEDRNSMAFSVETRLPFLDYELAESVVNYPTDYKIRHGWTKYVMRKALQDIMPPEVIRRRTKMGFVTPQETWMRSELKDRITEIFFDPTPASMNYVDYRKLKSEWKAFYRNKRSISHRDFFRVLVLELWMREFGV